MDYQNRKDAKTNVNSVWGAPHMTNFEGKSSFFIFYFSINVQGGILGNSNENPQNMLFSKNTTTIIVYIY